MPKPLSEMMIVNYGKEDEQRYALVEAKDIDGIETRECFDIYDSHNSLVERVGYYHGMTTNQFGVNAMGDILTPMTKELKAQMDDLRKLFEGDE